MPKCIECDKGATYGTVYKKPIHCASHKKINEVNVKHKRCEHKNCIKKASYAIEGQSAIHCKEHKTLDEIDVRHKRCLFQGCHKRPIYGLIGGKAIHCKKHKKENEIDLNNKNKCQEIGCSKSPSYGPQKGVILHCFEHKKEGETNQKHKKCEHKDCNIQATFGITTPIHCYTHKNVNEKQLTKRLCEYKNCNLRAIFGVKGKLPKHCSTHKTNNEIDLNSKKCINCNLFIVSKKPYKCSYCKDNSSKRKKTKEMKVVNFFREQKINFIHNKSIGASCGSYRPDLLFDAGTHFVIIEVDENQHKSISNNDRYGNICERVRENNIFIALGLPTVFIRYNPDSCKISNKTIRITTKNRLNILLERVKFHMKNVPSKHLSAEFLFYDDYEKRTKNYETIDVEKLKKFQEELNIN
jgi:hypothetical protein